MIPKTISTAFLSSSETRWLAPAAARLCRHFDAHLVGVHGLGPLLPMGGDLVSDPVILPEMLEWQSQEAEAIRETFEAALKAEDIAGEFRSPADDGDAREDFLIDGCRSADVILSAHIPRQGGRANDIRLQEQLIRQAGRPVVVMDEALPLPGPAQHLLIGVSCTRESMRAAHDALYLAAGGARIDLLSVSSSQFERRASRDLREDLASALDRRGYNVTVLEASAPTGEIGKELMRVALERGADLVAVGAFGHSKLFDFVIGAVTSMLLETVSVPVLFAK